MVADAVVIGSGPNGLVAANLLADAGWSVVVLEAAAHPGGAVRTAELTVPGFRHDLYSAFHPLAAASPVIEALGLEHYGLRWRHAPGVLAHVFPDDRSVLLSRDVERTAESVGSFAAQDAAAWRSEYARYLDVRDDLIRALLRPFPPVRAGLGLLTTLGVAEALRAMRVATMPVRRYGEERFAGEGARILLAGNAMHTDLGPNQAGSAVFGWLLAMLGQDVGFPVPQGGAGSLTDALVRRLESRGGRVECSRPVTKVLVARGKAVGVVAGGDHVRAAKAVLADVPAPVLYRDLVGADLLPGTLLDDIANFDWDDSTIKVDWALSGPIPWRSAAASAAGTVHLGVDADGLVQVDAELGSGRVPERPFLLLGQMTTADPSRSPAGTESAWLYSHVPRGGHWPAERLATWADGVEDIVATHAPGFRDLVLGRVVSGPRDLQSGNPSLVDGAINSGTAGIHQQLVFRPTPGLARADTVIERLFLASASAHPGGGVHGAPGANAARAALASHSYYGPVYRPLMRGLHRTLHPPKH
ncbi:phytoene desaturase family protein [Actinokineospora globicatena]|uniref:phytoene desaturase family protein n=1 Tax=Actinokineospora globicatena TaxID=103729 RepID=UPI0020A412DB|nr:NAD(P)/FAD-dependent oxidoreductase [Actinokineospora globicatena]MCP2304499.1 Phytoene dehydrogenase-related protein [Actinokineospora globicatena]GLW78133.1 FAD-dependent oxidoreductase [Actinokineospora globicatena]GLW85201.1 FAD-dependent oxidoreductase [Actinokineospora globicatena]